MTSQGRLEYLITRKTFGKFCPFISGGRTNTLCVSRIMPCVLPAAYLVSHLRTVCPRNQRPMSSVGADGHERKKRLDARAWHGIYHVYVIMIYNALPFSERVVSCKP